MLRQLQGFYGRGDLGFELGEARLGVLPFLRILDAVQVGAMLIQLSSRLVALVDQPAEVFLCLRRTSSSCCCRAKTAASTISSGDFGGVFFFWKRDPIQADSVSQTPRVTSASGLPAPLSPGSRLTVRPPPTGCAPAAARGRPRGR